MKNVQPDIATAATLRPSPVDASAVAEMTMPSTPMVAIPLITSRIGTCQELRWPAK